MNLLKVHFFKRLKYFHNNANIMINSYASSNKKYNVSSSMKSGLYPDHKIIYIFPYIKIPYILNKIKRNCTILFCANIPITVSLHMWNYITLNENISFLSYTFLVTFMLHITSFPCNYSVGSIYLKEDTKNFKDQKVIVSYVNYWGKRINFETVVRNINFINKSGKLYNKFCITSCKNDLKIFMKYGKIIEENYFYSIFNDLSYL